MTSSAPSSDVTTPSPPSWNASASSSPPSSAPAPAPRSRRWVTPVVAVVVAAVLIVGVLAAAGFLFHKSTTTTTESFATMGEAESVAGPEASHALSGSWNAVIAVGVRLSIGFSLPISDSASLGNLTAGCNLTEASGAPTSLAIDGTPPATPAGHAAFWIVGLSNGAAGFALVSVDLGIPTALYSVSGSSCAGGVLGYLAPFPASELDSPALVAAANASGASPFLAQYPTATQLLVSIGGLSVGGVGVSAVSFVVDTSCPVPLIENVTGAEFNATISGTTGVVENHSSGSVNCAAGLGNAVSGVGLISAPYVALAKAI
ncbi:MAG: hypothetical protein L3K02_06315 [Thermoplasmata archaeon]|nr:hypothetical protein [Thermoplasmata archaeon]